MPTGISTGEIIVLEIVSAIVRNDAPSRKEQGTNILLSAPTINLRMCGIISPTNPIGPEIDITAPIDNEVAM